VFPLWQRTVRLIQHHPVGHIFILIPFTGLNSLTEPGFLVYNVATPSLDRILATLEFGEEQQQIIRKCRETRIARISRMNEASDNLVGFLLVTFHATFHDIHSRTDFDRVEHWKFSIDALEI
jgi:hypothetical protein